MAADCVDKVMWANDWTFITSVLAQTYASPTLQQSPGQACAICTWSTVIIYCWRGKPRTLGVIASAAAQVQYIHGSLPAWPGTCGRSLHCLCIASLVMLRESWLSAHALIVM